MVKIKQNLILKFAIDAVIESDEHGNVNIQVFRNTNEFRHGFEEIVQLFEKMKECFNHVMLGVKYCFTANWSDIKDVRICDRKRMADAIKKEKVAQFEIVCKKIQNENIFYDYDVSIKVKKKDLKMSFGVILKDKHEANDFCFMDARFDYTCQCCHSKPFFSL